jgi:putative alpha-1,2-mannosidase
VAKYVNRSAGWQNLWNSDVEHAGFTGFLTPRNSSGAWVDPETYNPALCGGCEWSAITYEAVPFEYSFVVPHDMETLVQFMGGETEFERRLDYIVSLGLLDNASGGCRRRLTLVHIVYAQYLRAGPQ